MDVYEVVTNRVIEKLESGIIPWEKPWTGIRNGAFNRVSGKPYSFLNQLLLNHDGEYATFQQWVNLGGKIKKGAKSEIVAFYKLNEYEKEKSNGEVVEVKIPVLRYYNVFHISQVEGVEPLKEEELPKLEVDMQEQAEQLIKSYCSALNAGPKFIEELGNEAYYSPVLDAVHVPVRYQFNTIEEFYSTVFHEIIHSTGHKSRLNRLDKGEGSKFGSQVYSKEELVAEIGTIAVLNQLGLETKGTFNNSAAYIQSWLRQLKNDKHMIVQASSQAEKAFNLVMKSLEQKDSEVLITPETLNTQFFS